MLQSESIYDSVQRGRWEKGSTSLIGAVVTRVAGLVLEEQGAEEGAEEEGVVGFRVPAVSYT